MIKYVIWDFNGTILDDRHLSLELLNQILKKQNKASINEETYLNIFGFPIKKYYQKAGVDFEKESFESLAKWYIQEYQPLSLEQNLHDGVKEALIILKKMGITNICLSASEQKNLEEQLKHFEIAEHFDYILGTNNIEAKGKDGVGKNFIKSHNINPEECLFLGDTIYDFDIAKKIGSEAVLFSGGHQSRKRLETKTKYIIDNIYDIINIINKDQRRNKMKKFFKDFVTFISKGNVLDLAVGIIIGGAFNKIISSVVNDVLMPVISLMFKGDVRQQFTVLRGTAEYVANPSTGVLELVKSSDAVLLYWGNFLQAVFDFLIIGLTLFVIIRVVATLRKRHEARKEAFLAKRHSGKVLTKKEEEIIKEPVVTEDILLLREIRDSLKKE